MRVWYTAGMKYAIIDIGSNSVRCMHHDGTRCVDKRICTTRLAFGMGQARVLVQERMQETAQAVEDFYREAVAAGAIVRVFATAAVRDASNRQDFLNRLSSRGIAVEVIAGEEEARLGFLGAYTHGTCAVLDIGGGSTEVTIGDSGGIVYARSVPVGLSVIYDRCGEDIERSRVWMQEQLQAFADMPAFDRALAIGGTATTFAAMLLRLKTYDRNLTDGCMLDRNAVQELTERIAAMSLSEREQVAGLHPKRRDLIVGGGRWMTAWMRLAGVTRLQVRESDNLEGYWLSRFGKGE